MKEISHAMLYSGSVTCTLCDLQMWRIPQTPNVNWNGLPPSQAGEMSPEVKDAIYNQDRRRDEYLSTKGAS
jgi:hypothetical protein